MNSAPSAFLEKRDCERLLQETVQRLGQSLAHLDRTRSPAAVLQRSLWNRGKSLLDEMRRMGALQWKHRRAEYQQFIKEIQELNQFSSGEGPFDSRRTV